MLRPLRAELSPLMAMLRPLMSRSAAPENAYPAARAQWFSARGGPLRHPKVGYAHRFRDSTGPSGWFRPLSLDSA